jgi:hypothetical protein
VGNSNELWKIVRTEGKVRIRTLETEGLRHPNTQTDPILVATRQIANALRL